MPLQRNFYSALSCRSDVETCLPATFHLYLSALFCSERILSYGSIMMIANFCTLMHVNILNEACQSWIIGPRIMGPFAVIGLIIVPLHSDCLPPRPLVLPLPWPGNLEYLSGPGTGVLIAFMLAQAWAIRQYDRGLAIVLKEDEWPRGISS